MAREDLHFRLRIPEPLKKRIEEAAAKNRRSMTAEIVAALEIVFPEHRALLDWAETMTREEADTIANGFDDRLAERLTKVAESLTVLVDGLHRRKGHSRQLPPVNPDDTNERS